MISLKGKKWRLEKPDPSVLKSMIAAPEIFNQVRLSLKTKGVALGSGEKEGETQKLSELMGLLLVNRGIVSKQEASYFLQAQLQDLHDPFLMKGMAEAAERVVQAIEAGESITVFCDYDVDGVTSAAFLVHFFRDLGVAVNYYLPERKTEGYGLNAKAVEKIKAEGCSLMITADCGITAVAEARLAKELGMDLIITDHHQVSSEGLPEAIAVLNPHREDCNYPYAFLAGVGLAFKLATAVRSLLYKGGRPKESLPNLKQHLDLIALGTIADVAPLTGENHILVRCGLEVAHTTDKPGLAALKEVSGVTGKIDPVAVGFGLGPRLNAAGRLGKADIGFHLLTTKKTAEALGLARELDIANDERRELQKLDIEEAEYLLSRRKDAQKDSVIVLASENFHSGVIGIVAGRIAEKYFRPTVLIALDGEIGKASARSIPAFNLHKAFSECSEWMVQFGGHAYAAGMSIEREKVDAFRDAINAVGQRILSPEDLIPELRIDAVLHVEDVHMNTCKALELLEPCGASNPVPIFLIEGVQIQGLRKMGEEGQHVRFRAVQNGKGISAIGFNLSDEVDRLTVNQPVDIACQIKVNDWGGTRKAELKLEDIRPSRLQKK